eukprot:TRINITY_DN9649_c0_g1_i4.p1 TRINITY_DN9649_c0_g1~~TRINITY_DN9649_c0_g1_i4.p1  ORF type:complete len:667 (+),score=146.62 TRINITY_DN9649_c0_g1_i4:100-2001(+)
MDQYLDALDVQAYKRLDLRMVRDIPPEIRNNVRRYNRYNDILPTPGNRVYLRQIGDDEESTYINANYVPFSGKNNEYIAAMGPLPATIPSFIRMMWEQKCVVCVMTTNFVEKGRRKCERYWPEDVGSTDTYGGIQVTNVEMIPADGFVQTRLRLTRNGVQREIMHFHYNTWPDRGVPTLDGRPHTQPVVRMLTQVRNHRQQTDGSEAPMLVHCSAGVGRTGCFILIDQAFRMLEMQQRVDLVELIERNRRFRMAFVQTHPQYEFAWQAVAGYVRFRVKAAKQAPPAAAAAAADPMPVGSMVETTTNFNNPEGHDETLTFTAGQRGRLVEKTEHWWRVRLQGEEGWVQPDHLKPYTAAPAKAAPKAPAVAAAPAAKGPVVQDSNPFGTAAPRAEAAPEKKKAKGITRNPFLQSVKVKPGQSLRSELKVRAEALENTARASKPEALAAEPTQPSFEDIMDMAIGLDQDGNPLPDKVEAVEEEEDFDEAEPHQPSFEEIMNMATQLDQDGNQVAEADEEEEDFDEADPVDAGPAEASPSAINSMTPKPAPAPRERPIHPFLSSLPPWTYIDENGELRRMCNTSTHHKRLAAVDQSRLRTPKQIIGPAMVSHNHTWIELRTGLPAFDRLPEAIVSEC